jgi:hypothetical protein
MSKGRYNYYDPEYDPNVTEGNELLLMVNDQTFSFVVLQTDSKRVLVWGEEYDNEELRLPSDLKGILTAKYSDVKAVVTSATFTIIPKELYKESDLSEYGRFLTLEPGDTLLVNEIDEGSNVVFKVDEETLKSLKNRVSQKSIFFTGKVFVAAISFGRHDNTNLYAHVEGSRLQLLHFRNGMLNFYNSFEFQNPDELMYFIVLTANELELNLDETSLMLSGEVNISDKKIHRVSDLLPKVYLNQTKIVLLPQGFLPHQILLLSGLTLCASLVEN